MLCCPKVRVGDQIEKQSDETIVATQQAIEWIQSIVGDLAGRPKLFGVSGIELNWERGQITEVRPYVKWGMRPGV